MSVAAWLLTPVVFVLLASGVASGFERAVGVRLPDDALVPFGFCAMVIVALFGFWAGLHGGVVTIIVVALAVAGWVLRRGSLREHVARHVGLTAFAGIYVLYLLPVLASGHWTWTGYNFVNDTAVQMLLTDHLISDALANPGFNASSSTGSEVLRIYLSTNYPVGSHSVLAVLDVVVPGQLASLYQPYLGVLGGTAAVALNGLLKRAGASPCLAVVGGVVAMAANLTYQYALQGNVKELALIATLAGAALVGEAVVRTRQLGVAMALGVCGAAILAVYSAAGAPYLAALVLCVLVALLVSPVAWRWLLRALAAATVVLLVAALPALTGLITFGQVASGTFATQAAQTSDLGQLLRPLKVAQVTGIWLNNDYRLPATGTKGAVTDALGALVLVAALVGLWRALRPSSRATALFAVPVVGAFVVLSGRVSPYANGKLLAIASVGVVFLAWLAIATASRHQRTIATFAGVLICFGVAWSDALAYHGVKLAPTARMAALQDIGKRLEGRGLVLFNEPEEFGKYFLTPAQMNASTEAITPRQVRLRQPQGFGNRYFDLDAQTLDYVEGFSWIVQRRSPAASRPPANYRQVYENAFYVLWKRAGSLRVLEHFPLESQPGGIGRPPCRDIARLARRAGPGGHLVAAVRGAPLVLDTATAERSPGWTAHPYLPGMVIAATPGQAWATADLKRGGRYRAWVEGSFGRKIAVLVDGRTVGSAKGVDNLGQWHDAGEVRLAPGRHTLEIVRGGGGLAPGDGYLGELGPLLLSPLGRSRLETIAPQSARRLCGGTYDWVEAVRG